MSKQVAGSVRHSVNRPALLSVWCQTSCWIDICSQSTKLTHGAPDVTVVKGSAGRVIALLKNLSVA